MAEHNVKYFKLQNIFRMVPEQHLPLSHLGLYYFIFQEKNFKRKYRKLLVNTVSTLLTISTELQILILIFNRM